MSNDAALSRAAAPGDILLLCGKSKSRPLNLGYQSLVRNSRALYTHVALVISPFRVIHATPGKGVEIRAWREIRDQYSIRESSVARLQYLDDDHRDKLMLRAHYYFGQRYSLLALRNPPETFNDQEGIVCSQLVAQVFRDVGMTCASNGARRCLPLDIHIHTQESPDWLRIPFCDYQFDSPREQGYDLLHKSRDIVFELDGYAASLVKDNFSTSQAIVALERALQSMVMAVETGQLKAADLLAHLDFAADALSPRHWVAEWKRHFATPQSPAAFMHEDGNSRDRMKRLFMGACDAIGNTAHKAFDHMEEMAHLFDGWLAVSSDATVDIQPNELYRQLLALHENMRARVDNLDHLLDWTQNLSDDFTLDFPAILASGIYESEEEITSASRCLLNIADFANAISSWDAMRTAVLATFEERPCLESTTPPPSAPYTPPKSHPPTPNHPDKHATT